MSADNEQLVRDFCDAFARRDIDELMGFFAPDAVYHNMPMDPARGHDAIRAVLELFVPPSDSIEFEILHIASTSDAVLTERIDRFRMGDRDVVLPVSGTFEIVDGKIAAWRDYFDMATFTRQSSGS